MPSGITHILLTKKFRDKLPDGRLKDILDNGSDFLQVGAVTPDLPYASQADSDLFLTNEIHLADYFHYRYTNQIPLRAFALMRTGLSPEEQWAAFSFFMGYASHVIADSVIHPFVRDKVGNYKGNEKEHRELEMKLDVLVYHDYTAVSGHAAELNYSNLHDELQNINTYQETGKVIAILQRLIRDVYRKEYEIAKIMDWARGMHRLFAFATGKFPVVVRGCSVVYKNYADVFSQRGDCMVLEKPIDNRKQNFLNSSKVSFFYDCIPQYYKVIVPFAQKAYEYVFNNGPELTAADLPATNLDTGRPVADGDNLDLMPVYWR